MGQVDTAALELAVVRGQLARQDEELRRLRQRLKLEQEATAKLQQAIALMAEELRQCQEASVAPVNVAVQVVIQQEDHAFLAGIPVRAPQLTAYQEVARLS